MKIGFMQKSIIVGLILAVTVALAYPPYAKHVQDSAILHGVAAGFKDPDTVKFKDVTIKSASVHLVDGIPNNNVTVCGQVNATNSFGAFTGYQYFFYVGLQVRGGEPVQLAMNMLPDDASLDLIKKYHAACNG